MNSLAIIYIGKAQDSLRKLSSGSVRCCVTSPPYWGLRDYGHKDQIGMEPTPEQYIENLVDVFREVKRVLAVDGTLWVNIGDAYAGSGKGGAAHEYQLTAKQASNRGSQHYIKQIIGETAREAAVTNVSRRMSKEAGYKPKDLIGLPFMLAFALRADGWYWRAPIIWSKPNPMPGSQTDRPTISHEYVWLMSKSRTYYYDHEAVMEPCKGNGKNWSASSGKNEQSGRRTYAGFNQRWNDGNGHERKMRTRRSVWEITPKAFKGAHFATFPPALVEPCILAGSKEGDLVLDPFGGSMTTGVVAIKHGRDFIGCDLSTEYVREIGAPRLTAETGCEPVIIG